jgi:hypothetical protein
VLGAQDPPFQTYVVATSPNIETSPGRTCHHLDLPILLATSFNRNENQGSDTLQQILLRPSNELCIDHSTPLISIPSRPTVYLRPPFVDRTIFASRSTPGVTQGENVSEPGPEHNGSRTVIEFLVIWATGLPNVVGGQVVCICNPSSQLTLSSALHHPCFCFGLPCPCPLLPFFPHITSFPLLHTPSRTPPCAARRPPPYRG